MSHTLLLTIGLLLMIYILLVHIDHSYKPTNSILIKVYTCKKHILSKYAVFYSVLCMSLHFDMVCWHIDSAVPPSVAMPVVQYSTCISTV